MEIIRISLGDQVECKDMAACIGYFDGMHIGHLKLVQETLKEASLKNIKSACITFDPDPWVVIKGMKDIEHITSMEERIEIGRQCGLDYWIILSFTKELAQLPCDAFEKMIADIHVKSLICGFDFSYGYKGAGNVDTLKKQELFDVIEVEEVTYENEKISSSRIEKVIQQGDMRQIVHLLGRPYSIKGNVVEGSSIGHTIGYPTANIKLKYHSLLPSIGVYIGYCYVDGKHYKCMMNVGHNPTMNYRDDISVEAFLVDFDEKIYGKDVELIFIEKIRDEIKFDNKEELIHQLDLDLIKTKML